MMQNFKYKKGDIVDWKACPANDYKAKIGLTVVTPHHDPGQKRNWYSLTQTEASGGLMSYSAWEDDLEAPAHNCVCDTTAVLMVCGCVCEHGQQQLTAERTRVRV